MFEIENADLTDNQIFLQDEIKFVGVESFVAFDFIIIIFGIMQLMLQNRLSLLVKGF